MSARARPAPTAAEIAGASALLGVPAGAPADEVRRAWRAAVRVTHPDRVDGAARSAAEHLAAGLNEARDVLVAVAGTHVDALPFGASPIEQPPTAPPPGSQMPAVTLPRTVRPAPSPAPPVATHSGRRRPVRETVGIAILFGLVAIAAVLVVVYEFFGGLLPL